MKLYHFFKAMYCHLVMIDVFVALKARLLIVIYCPNLVIKTLLNIEMKFPAFLIRIYSQSWTFHFNYCIRQTRNTGIFPKLSEVASNGILQKKFQRLDCRMLFQFALRPCSTFGQHTHLW